MNDTPRAPDGSPDVHSPEFRAHLFTHMLQVVEAKEHLDRVAMIIRGCHTPEDITAYKWSLMQESLPHLEFLLEHVTGTVKQIELFTEDKEAMDLIKDRVMSKMRKDRE